MGKKIIILICALIISIPVIFSGCTSAISGQMENARDKETKAEERSSASGKIWEGKEFREISVDEAYKIFNSSENYLFIDVRSKEQYDNNHVKGAISIPVTEIKENLDKIPKEKIIIVYCSGSGCDISSSAAAFLVQNGFARVYNMGGLGILEWMGKDYPLE